MARVLIVQRGVPDYRVPFFNGLGDRLRNDGIELVVAAGPADTASGFSEGLPRVRYAQAVQVRSFARRAYLHVGVPAPDTFDLVVMQQELACLRNYGWILRRRMRPRPLLAYWGHGSDRQAGARASLQTKVRAGLNRSVDWWFAYTDSVREVLNGHGVPDDRISVVNNAIETASLADAVAAIPAAERDELRAALFPDVAEPSTSVALFCARLTPGKRVETILRSMQAVQATRPGARLLIIGDGPEAERVQSFCRKAPWCAWVGAHHGQDRAPYFAVADALLLPFEAGLSLLDGMAAGLPIVTSEAGGHGPEIDYVRHETNGLVADAAEASIAAALHRLAADAELHAALRAGALDTAANCSIAAMVDRFADGIHAALRQGTRS